MRNKRTARLAAERTEPIARTAERLNEYMRCSAFSAEKVLEERSTPGNAEIILLVYEKYYMRNGSYASLTVQLTDDGTRQTAVLAGSGGGEGLLNWALGANADFVSSAADFLKKLGFAE